MRYENVKEGKFLERPNRFIAYVEIGGEVQVCHVKNTGRCKELLVPGVRVLVQECDNPERKTKYDLIAVYKGDALFNIDSQAPNKVFGEWLKSGEYFKDITFIKPEKTFGSSRFDFYFEYGGKKAFAEVKGVTLERDGVFLFPDAPTERGVRHIKELIECKAQGYDAFAVFVVQAEGAESFVPNAETHPEFSEVLKRAEKSGVKILCLSCRVTENSLEIKGFVPTKL
ncbi:MAG: DNA/RNA nuclease SfsA [Clostridia bacterium]|nr:DNA/RNA nuclease SfsA [Clostridia bacterium]